MVGDHCDFFISHAGVDRAWAEWVSWQLAEAGYTVELAVWDWAPGRNVVTAMSDALDRCDRVLALWSAAYFDRSRYTTEEWTAVVMHVAGRGQDRLLPVRIEEVPPELVPAVLRPLVFCDLVGVDAGQARQRLLDAAAGPRRPDGEPVFPGSAAPDALRRLGSQRPEFPGNAPPVLNAPPRNPAFTGRAEVLEQLGQRLAAGPVAVVAVRGLGGVGKSQVALEYAYRMRESGRYELAAWVRADSPVTVVEDLAAIAPLLGIDVDGPTGELAAAVVAVLGSRRDWLVVFDNAQDPADLAGMLPGGSGHVLITSRSREWSRLASRLDLEEFTRLESVAFVCQRADRAEPDAAGELAEVLGDLPLALAQAAAYIDTHAITIRDYLGLYRDPEVARRLRATGLASDEYPESVARTWLLHFDRLRQERPAAIELLRLCAFLDPDAVDLELLSPGSAETGEVLAAALADPLERTETAGALARASLVTIAAEGHLRVHRLVQAVTRDQLDSDQAAAWAASALWLIAAVFPDTPAEHRSWPVCAGLAAHAAAVTTFAEPYPDLAEKSAALLNLLGIYLHVSAQHKAARATLERALAVKEAVYGPDHPEVAGTLTMLGLLQKDLGDLPAARATLERALAIMEAVYGPDHRQVAATLGNLGIVQKDLGDLSAARATQERVLVIFEATDRPDQPNVAIALTNLGIIQRRMRDLPAARATLERALAVKEGVFGPDHPEVAITLTNLGVVQAELGDLPAARATLERALAVKEAVFGPDHPEVAITLANLGIVQKDLEDLPAARATLERALASFEAAYGPDHAYAQEARAALESISTT